METLISQDGRKDRNQRKYKKWRRRERKFNARLENAQLETAQLNEFTGSTEEREQREKELQEVIETIEKTLDSTRRKLAQLRGERVYRPTRKQTATIRPSEEFTEYIHEMDYTKRADDLWAETDSVQEMPFYLRNIRMSYQELLSAPFN